MIPAFTPNHNVPRCAVDSVMQWCRVRGRFAYTNNQLRRFRRLRASVNAVVLLNCKGAITSKIKHAIIKHAVKLKTSPAKLAQLLQPSLAFCFSLQLMTAYRPGLSAAEIGLRGRFSARRF